MDRDTPTPGEFVYKETPWDDYNKTRCVPDSRWGGHSDDALHDPPADDEFVTQSLNRLGILDKRHADEVEWNDGRWEIPYEEDE